MVFNNKKVIVCDMDGTLIDSIGLWNDVDKEIVSMHGKTPHENIGIERTKFLSENTSGDIYAKYAGYLMQTYNITGYTNLEFSDLRSKLSTNYHENYMDYKPYADEFLLKAKELGYMLILATSSSKWIIDIYSQKNANMMKKANMKEVFDHILTREDVNEKKPNPQVYLEAIKRSKMNKNEIIALEDELVGVESATSAGIQVISMYDKYSDLDRQLIDSMADYSFNDYMTLTKRLK